MSTHERVLHCAECGAQLSPAPDAKEIVCAYCGATTVREDERAPPPPPNRGPTRRERRAQRERERDHARRAARRKQIATAVFTVAFLAAAAGALAYLYFRTERTWRGTPVLADVDRDGVEDILGHWQENQHDHIRFVVGLIDGASHDIRWSYVVPTGKYVQDEDLALADGGALAVASGKPELLVLDVRTGKLRATIDLPDAPQFVVAHGSLARVWLHSGEPVTVDLAKGQLVRDAAEPAWAPFDTFQDCPAVHCAHGHDVPGMHVVQEQFEPGSDDAVEVGRKEMGTHLGMLAGVSRSTGQVKWTRTLSSPDGTATQPLEVTVAHGRAYFEYEVENPGQDTYHVAAISASTGEIVWDFDRKSWHNSSSIVAGQRVYVTTQHGLLVLDAETGARIVRLW
ncbi:MAG: PQQ-binding-like beta-propeller repeat protein [Acidobacteriota bacterium]